MSEPVKTGKITVEFNYEIFNHGTEEEPMYDFYISPMNDTLESDSWFPDIEEAERYIRYRLSSG